DDGGDGGTIRRVNAVSTPHLWASVLVYLTAMAYERPELFDRYASVLPAVDVPLLDAASPTQAGCGCKVAGGGAGGLASLLALAPLASRPSRSLHRQADEELQLARRHARAREQVAGHVAVLGAQARVDAAHDAVRSLEARLVAGLQVAPARVDLREPLVQDRRELR